MNRKQKKALVRIIVSAVLVVGLEVLMRYVEVPRLVELVVYLVPYLIIGFGVLKKAVRGIWKKQVFDENFLMAVATVGAIALGDYKEGVAVMLFYQVGELFESVAVGRSRQSISALMDIRPDYANVIRRSETAQPCRGEAALDGEIVKVDPEEVRPGEIVKVDPEEVQPGEIIVVNPGEKIPIDGIIISGSTMINTSALTGESVPRSAKEGDEVISGCINESGVIRLRTTKEFGESTVSKILELVENASSKKSRSENFISRFAKVYTPAVCFSALALAVIPPVVSLVAGREPLFAQWIYRALSFLVISCPCALVISIPLSFFAGIGGAGREGVLVKGSNYLEALASVKYVVFDKTGTVTQGVFEVTGIHHSELEQEELLDIAAHAESHSSHPIAKSILRAYGKPIDDSRVNDIREIGGQGIAATVDGHQVAIGNARLMKASNIEYIDCTHIGTVVHVGIDGKYAGHILISDIIKDGAEAAMADLKRAGIRKTVMLTGDTDQVAQAVAQELKIDEVHSELMPADKVEWVEKILAQKSKGEQVAFVGDGINDAPVLTRADVGIAMGALGSDAAIEAADVVLMDDDPAKIAAAMRIARKCIRIVYENIWFAIGVKAACLVLGAIGITNMWVAIFADVGVMVIAVLNAIRALTVRKAK